MIGSGTAQALIADTYVDAGGHNVSTNPAQFATLANLTLPTAGLYSIGGILIRTGTDDTQNQNVAVKVGATTKLWLPTPLGIAVPWQLPRYQAAAGDVPFLQTLNASAAGAIYISTMYATRIG